VTAPALDAGAGSRASRPSAGYAGAAMDEFHELPGWMRKFEAAMITASVLCTLGVLMMLVLHLFARSACFSMGICT
jgi:hypothetical protein